MRLDLDNLPHDTVLLHQLVRDMAAIVSTRDDEIERLQAIIKKLQRMQFGRQSERLDADQFALGLEDLDADIGRIEESRPVVVGSSARPHRESLPDHLPREDALIDTDHDACPDCGGVLHDIGESISEMLDWVPAQLRVMRITRPKYGCRACGTIHQAPAPERLIAGGLATPALIAQVLTAKYCDHMPLYRQSQIFARHGVDLARSTLAGWVGGACWWLEALHEKLCADVFASDHLFADDTPVPVLDPGRRKTKTGRLWVYAREQRGWNGPAPRRIATLYEIEAAIRGRSPAHRLTQRQSSSRPHLAAMKCWLEDQLALVPARSTLAEAIRYALGRWKGLTRFLDDGRIELDTNPVERAIRPIALGRKNHLFAGSDGGGHRWAVICSLIETAKLNGVEPYAWLSDVLASMVDGQPANQLDQLLPWNWTAQNPINRG
ncbi:IS66 family transposase [Sphingosinicella microcystinivorans]|uniref:IS66 family transposase n=1 Tax=Sphingosinicella microcystinivorans TaxID=335406 RepID=UPI0022F3C887|nr:IS66 family transposase [Sphingosinicella microcystinivorans]WBX86218.1 IS66 family transposase [Sphingosinicella microcystinivorans]